VHVTHDQEEAMTMADTVAVMNAGRIEQLGPPADLYELPATPFVANFLGQSNLIGGDVTGRSGGDILVTAHGSRFSVSQRRSRAAATAVYLGIRPEKLRLSPLDPGRSTAGSGSPHRLATGAATADEVPAGHQCVEGIVTDSSYVGVSTQYLVRTGWGTELAVFASNTGAAAPLPVGADVVAHWDPAHAFLLDREPGAGDQTAPLLDEPVSV
jgi:spermidine/putrescine transport system ATP-binding protein